MEGLELPSGISPSPHSRPEVWFEGPNPVAGDLNFMGHLSDLPTYHQVAAPCACLRESRSFTTSCVES